MDNNKRILIAFLVWTALSSISAYNVGKYEGSKVSKQEPKIERKMDIEEEYGSFAPIVKIIRENYYFDIDEDKMKEEVKKAIFSSLGDPYSQYLTEQDMNDLKKVNTGKFIGIGVQVTIKENGDVTVISPIKDSPGEKAGILPEDIIVKINDIDVPKNDLEATVKLIRGDEKIGSDVKLTVKRMVDNKEQFVDFYIKRDEIQTTTVQSEMLEGDILYISISNFAEKTGEDFDKALTRGLAKGYKSLIIDVRNNPGGLLTSVISVADRILPEGDIMKVVNAKKHEDITKSTEGFIDRPIVVLINKGSASASEVLSVALKDNGKATLVGEKSFGKGIIQNVIPWSNNNKLEGLKLTVAEYFGPKGTKIHKVGLTPDVEVQQNPAKIGTKHLKEDMQLQKAIEILKKK